MKNFLKKVNRGVALAIVLLAGLMIFFVVDAAAFSREEDALKEFLEEYLEECAKVNLLPEQYREQGAEIPDNVIETKTQEAKDFVEKYFTEYKRSNSYSSTKSNILNNVNYMFDSNKKTGSTIKNLEYSLVSISSIKKQAANAVRISFKINVKMSATYEVQFINIARTDWGIWSYSKNGYTEDSDNTEIQEVSGENDVTLTLFKVNGKWKIAESEMGGGSYYMGGSYVSNVRIG